MPSTTPAEPANPVTVAATVVGSGPGRIAVLGVEERGSTRCVGVHRPRGRIEPAPDQSRQRGQGGVAGVHPSAVGDLVGIEHVAGQCLQDLAEVEEEDVVAQPGQLAGSEHEGPQHPEVADHLAAGELAIAGDPAPLLDLPAHQPGLQREPMTEPDPGQLPDLGLLLLLRLELRA